jgi:isopenicillin-N epimerase
LLRADDITSGLPGLWGLDPTVTYLNHGSFGACPRAVLELQTSYRERLEREPMRFFLKEHDRLLDEAREAIARFVGAAPEGVVLVRNPTTAVSAVLRSLDLSPGDEILLTDHTYAGCWKAAEHVAARAGARVTVARLPFPLSSAEEVEEAVLRGASERTRLALIDHVTSPTGLALPVSRLVPELQARGVDCLVDGAHAPGMIPLDVASLGAAYYVGHGHKWLCAPKGVAFLWVREDRRDAVAPPVLSLGRAREGAPGDPYLASFAWNGTDDWSPAYCLPFAIEHLGAAVEGGWTGLMARNRKLALEARRTLCTQLGVGLPAPDDMVASLATVPLPGSREETGGGLDPLQVNLIEDHRMEVPVVRWPAPPGRGIRLSAQLYNTIPDFERLAEAVVAWEQRRSRPSL